MRILVLPAPGSARSWYVDSSYTIFRKMMDYLDDRVYAYFGFEDELDKDIVKAEESDNVEIISLGKGFEHFRACQRYCDKELLNKVHPNSFTPVDAILTARTQCALSIQLASLYTSPKYGYIPVLPVELITCGGRAGMTEWDAMTKASSFCSLNTVLLREGEIKVNKEWIRKYASYKKVDKFLDNVSIQSQGIDVDEIEQAVKDTEKHEKMTLFYGGRFNGIKNWEKTLDALQHAYQIGKDVDVKALCPMSKQLSKKFQSKFDGVTVLRRMKHSEFIRELAKCHLFMYLSKYEAFPVGALEQLLTGSPLIALKADWSVEILGEDYPFLARDLVNEPIAMTKWIIDNYEEACEMIQPTIKRLKKTIPYTEEC